MKTQLRITGDKGIIDENDNEPNKKIEVARQMRAGSIMPSGLDTESYRPSTELEESWKKWQRLEDLAQGMIRRTVSDAILVDLLSCHSAKEMRDFALETDSLDDPETQADIWNKSTRMRLDEDPTAKQIEDHLERFNSLL